ncbi:hypothetical protein [Pyrofollis japonicus]|uniref:hypothetical protein n=1 Tax=Pyrofollis japonicus TaxID=3060460 RepID=UPI00295B913A|nr:hypothetical protein [Pyrofollis japonicus]
MRSERSKPMLNRLAKNIKPQAVMATAVRLRAMVSKTSQRLIHMVASCAVGIAKPFSLRARWGKYYFQTRSNYTKYVEWGATNSHQDSISQAKVMQHGGREEASEEPTSIRARY